MVTIYGANSVSGYDVANSLRLNSGDSAQMNKTLGTATDVDKYTISMWVKRSRISHRQMMMRVINPSSTSTYAFLEFQSDNSIGTNDYDGSGSIAKVTNAKFKDPSAWMHIVLALDSTQGTASNRSKLYVNGTQITDFSTDTGGSQNQDLIGNTSGKNIYIGGDGGQDARYCGLYMAEVCFIDGQQLTPTSFGEFDEDSPDIWKPIDVSGLTFGNNGFYLDFEDSSNLGNDANGGTDLTEVNIVATDQSTDTCTNNFATLNPLTTWMSSDFTLSEGNLKISIGNNTEGKAALATFGLTTGKWYWEVKFISTTGASYAQIGITDEIYNDADSGSNKQGYGDYDYGYRGEGGGKKVNAGNYVNYGDSYGAGDVIGVALDLDNLAIYFHKNGTYQASGAVGDPTSGASRTNATFNISAASSTASGYYFPVIAKEDADDPIFEFNFGGTNSASFAISSGNSDANGYGNFEYAVPSGYYSINTKNLAEYG